jgi:hypothetical protein
MNHQVDPYDDDAGEFCTHCSGFGVDPEYGDDCSRCDGTGIEPDLTPTVTAMCKRHPAYEADNCPGCGTETVIPVIGS